MHNELDLQRWLAGHASGQPLQIGSETLSLRPDGGGAELSAPLFLDYTPAQLHAALRLGFDSALHFSAGLGLSADGRDLTLCRYLPQVTDWVAAAAAAALEELLNQLADWRAALAEEPLAARTRPADWRDEHRLRQAYHGVHR